MEIETSGGKTLQQTAYESYQQRVSMQTIAMAHSPCGLE